VLAVLAGVIIALIALVSCHPTSAQTRTPSASSTPIAIAAIDHPVSYRVTNTRNHGLNVRNCPEITCAKVSWLAEGGVFEARCWTQGAPVAGDSRWLNGTTTDNRTGFAAGHYLAGADVPACQPPAVGALG
jgi:hypothetical protein